MADRPFLCGNCGNWYTPVKLDDDDSCPQCFAGTHADGSHCHYSDMTATQSEVRLMGILETLTRSLTSIQSRPMDEAEVALANAEQAERGLADAVTWAGVKEMPGMVGEDPEKRFKSVDVIEQLVRNKRRPFGDLLVLRRSVKVCGEIAAEIPTLMSSIRMAMAEARLKPPTEAKPRVTRRAAPRRRKQPAAATA